MPCDTVKNKVLEEKRAKAVADLMEKLKRGRSMIAKKGKQYFITNWSVNERAGLHDSCVIAKLAETKEGQAVLARYGVSARVALEQHVH